MRSTQSISSIEHTTDRDSTNILSTTMDSKNGIVIQSGYFQASSAQRKYTMMPIVRTMLIGNKEISVFGALPCVEQDDMVTLFGNIRSDMQLTNLI
jgi:hypothetical protein